MAGCALRCARLAIVPVAAIVLGVFGAEPRQQRERFTVFTRLHYDMAYLHHFVDWYVGLGFDRVVAVQSDTELGNRYAPHPSGKLRIVASKKDRGDALLRMRTFSRHILTNSPRDWILAVDSDEFLVLSRPTIQQHLDALRAGRPAHEQRRLVSMQFRWAVAHHARPYCAPSMAPAILTAHPVQGRFLRQMARADAVHQLYDSHRFALRKEGGGKEGGEYYSAFEGAEAAVASAERRTRAAVAHSRAAFADSAVLHVATRSLANALTKHLAHAHAVAARPANESRAHVGARVFEAQYNLSTAGLVGLVHELGARSPRPPGADAAERPVGQSAAARDSAQHVARVARFVRALGPKGCDAFAGAASLLDGDRAAWDCGYQPAELSARLRRLLETSNVPREQPLCDAEQEKRALRALLGKEGVALHEFEAFAALLADAYANVLGAARRNPFAPVPAQLSAVCAADSVPGTRGAPPSSSSSSPSAWPTRNPSRCTAGHLGIAANGSRVP